VLSIFLTANRIYDSLVCGCQPEEICRVHQHFQLMGLDGLAQIAAAWEACMWTR
jgi:hypothetical protein